MACCCLSVRNLLRAYAADVMLTGMYVSRDKEHSTIIYESPQPDTPLLRLGWNKQDPRYMATLLMDCSKVVVLDIRYSFPARLNLLICIPNQNRYALHDSFQLWVCTKICYVPHCCI